MILSQWRPIFAAVTAVASLHPSQASQASTVTTGPAARAHHALVYDAARSRVLLIGGSTSPDDGSTYEFFDDIWAFDGKSWTNLGPAGSKRSGRAVAYDSKRHRVLSFGGFCGCPDVADGLYGDFLELNGVAWKALGPTSNQPLADAALVYDKRRDRAVLVGGGDTREFDGSAWQTATAQAPEPRRAFAMAYDEQRAQTVVFGGSIASTRTVTAETWVYDGASWTRMADTGPSPRHTAGLAYDSRRGRIVLFGGGSPGGAFQDTWAWDGARWTKLADNGPPARLMGALAYDAARDRIVLFGGRVRFPNDLNDTWEWDGKQWREVR